MILKESEIDQDTINEVLGKPYKEPGKWLTVTGSSYYFIKDLKNNLGEDVLKWDDSKGIFQYHDKGLALYINRSNYQRVVLLPFNEIEVVHLKVVEEKSTDQLLKIVSMMLSAIGLGSIANFDKKETVLEFKSLNYSGRFITSYSSYKSQMKYFSKMGLITN